MSNVSDGVSAQQYLEATADEITHRCRHFVVAMWGGDVLAAQAELNVLMSLQPIGVMSAMACLASMAANTAKEAGRSYKEALARLNEECAKRSAKQESEN